MSKHSYCSRKCDGEKTILLARNVIPKTIIILFVGADNGGANAVVIRLVSHQVQFKWHEIELIVRLLHNSEKIPRTMRGIFYED